MNSLYYMDFESESSNEEILTEIKNENNNNLKDEIKEIIIESNPIIELPQQKITTDFNWVENSPQKHQKGTKLRSIYNKEMTSQLPSIKWLPGEFFVLYGVNDEEHIKNFVNNALKYKIISLMIYTSEKNPFLFLAFSTINITLSLNLLNFIKEGKSIIIPPEIHDLLNNSSILVIIPGLTDWIYTKTGINLFDEFKDYLNEVPKFPNLISISDFTNKLKIQPTSKDISEHLKLIFWIFQNKFDFQIHGSEILIPLTKQWEKLMHFYGSLLIYSYYALKIKEEEFLLNPSKGVNLEPIYLETILKKYDILLEDELIIKKKLIGLRKYPNPYLPNINNKK